MNFTDEPSYTVSSTSTLAQIASATQAPTANEGLGEGPGLAVVPPAVPCGLNVPFRPLAIHPLK